jgi:hypothetical protein
MAAVSVVLPWSMCPIVPTLTWGFVRSNFCLAMAGVMLPDLGRYPLGPATTQAVAWRHSSSYRWYCGVGWVAAAGDACECSGFRYWPALLVIPGLNPPPTRLLSARLGDDLLGDRLRDLVVRVNCIEYVARPGCASAGR